MTSVEPPCTAGGNASLTCRYRARDANCHDPGESDCLAGGDARSRSIRSTVIVSELRLSLPFAAAEAAACRGKGRIPPGVHGLVEIYLKKPQTPANQSLSRIIRSFRASNPLTPCAVYRANSSLSSRVTVLSSAPRSSCSSWRVPIPPGSHWRRPCTRPRGALPRIISDNVSTVTGRSGLRPRAPSCRLLRRQYRRIRPFLSICFCPFPPRVLTTIGLLLCASHPRSSNEIGSGPGTPGRMLLAQPLQIFQGSAFSS
jgi:hypothetical protein